VSAPIITSTERREYLTVIWTARAVSRWDDHRAKDPRHTITSYPVSLGSPWFRDDMAAKFGAHWVLVDSAGALAARS